MDERTYWIFLVAILFIPVAAYSQDTPTNAGETEPQAKQQDAQDQFQFGYNAFQRGKLPNSLSHFKSAVSIDTTHEKSQFWLARTYYVLGYNDSAAKIWSKSDSFPEYSDWFKRELTAHRLRYDSPSYPMLQKWNYVGLISGERYDESRNINPSALLGDGEGGFYSASYRLGKLLRYSAEGRFLKKWEGLQTPSDIAHHPNKGILVAEEEPGRIRLVTDTGIQDFLSEGLSSPTRLIVDESTIYVFNFADQNLVQLTPDGDTVGVVWDGSTRTFIEDVAQGPEDNFWLVDSENNQLIVRNPQGELLRRVNLGRNVSFQNIWWKRNHLLVSGPSGLAMLGPRDGKVSYLSTPEQKLPGDDISDVLLAGDRLLLTSFQANQILLYRPPELPPQDMLVQDRRLEFKDFPIIRMNLILQDPLKSGRFRYLQDQNFGLEVDGLKKLPSFLRHSSEVYGYDWIIVVDNRFDDFQRWDEVRPFLINVIASAPSESRGSLWKVRGQKPVVQSFTSRGVLLRNRLSNLDVFRRSKTDREEAVGLLHDALNVAFTSRSPTGIIFVSDRAHQLGEKVSRVANRIKNSSIPLITINPSIESLPQNSPLKPGHNSNSLYLNFGEFDETKVWNHYRSRLRSHYTAIFRSHLNFQPSGRWQPFQLSFHYFDQVRRYDGGFKFK